MRILISIIIFISYNLIVNAQERHSTQYFFSPLSLSPANAGVHEKDMRFNVLYRDQWAKITNPYRTTAISAESKLLQGFLNSRNILGIGVQLINDQAGGVDLTQNDISASLAYSRSFDKKQRTYIGLGFDFGYITESFDQSKAIFDNQIVGSQINTNLSSGETTLSFNNSYFDVGLGVSFSYSGDKFNFYSGLSSYHINKPSSSFLSEGDYTVPRLDRMYVGFDYLFNKQFGTTLRSVYSMQNGQSEILVEALIALYFGHLFNIDNHRTLKIGTVMRLNDAQALVMRYDFGALSFSFSYDFTVSTLNRANQSQGALEIGLSYLIDSPLPSKNNHPVQCPRW